MCFRGCSLEDRMGFCTVEECRFPCEEALVWDKDEHGNWYMKAEEKVDEV